MLEIYYEEVAYVIGGGGGKAIRKGRPDALDPAKLLSICGIYFALGEDLVSLLRPPAD